MSLIPTVYKSSDPGAPLLSGDPGALVALLDLLLVDGYGSGANRKPGMGWTKAFTGTNVRAYRNSVLNGTGYYLRVDDTAQRSALVRGYSAMTDIDTGTDATPSVALKAAGSRWEKSFVASSEGRAWVAVGNEKFFYLFIDTSNAFSSVGSAAMHPHYAGDITSLKPGDRHNFVVSYKGSDTEGSNNIGYCLRAVSTINSSPTSDTTTYLFLARNYQAVPGSMRASLYFDGQTLTRGIGTDTNMPPYPYPVNNGLLYAPVVILEAQMTPRGYLPGLYAPLHLRPFPEMALLRDVAGFPSGTELLAKSFQADQMTYNQSYCGQVLIDISSEW